MRVHFTKEFNTYLHHDMESIIQAELYHQCKLHNIECFLEVKVNRIGRLDALIKINENYIIIECKNTNRSKIDKNSFQFLKYKKLKLPIVILNNSHDVELTINILKEEKLLNTVYIYCSKIKKLTNKINSNKGIKNENKL